MQRLRWELCKHFGWSVDDPRFLEIEPIQWQWYASMVAEDRRVEFEIQLNLVEYLASFWNSDAVSKIKKSRASAEKHAFQSDREFEQSVASGTYKDNPLIKALQKIRGSNTNLSVNDELGKESLYAKKMKGPIDLSSISKLIEE
jgi:hypothetical protein